MRHLRTRGFTLVELVVVIALTGVLASVVAIFLRAPVRQYVDLGRRAELSDTADTALRRIARDLRHALPNSVRVGAGCTGTNVCSIEFFPTVGGGRYRVGSGDELDFTRADTSFDVVGPMPQASTAHHVVVYNLGIHGADAYSGAAAATDVRRPISGVGAGSLSITSSHPFPFESPGQRFHVVSSPVRYVCNPQAGTLVREAGYGWPEAGTTGTSRLLARGVSRCLFTYEQSAAAQRSGLVTMQITLSEGGEGVSLYHAVHVSNQP
ncbi:MAG TPA: type II secretion system protein [Noviherbaspirillum sp.]|nr:type II secretion system protein [Noviherbaspirillum sp.]